MHQPMTAIDLALDLAQLPFRHGMANADRGVRVDCAQEQKINRTQLRCDHRYERRRLQHQNGHRGLSFLVVALGEDLPGIVRRRRCRFGAATAARISSIRAANVLIGAFEFEREAGAIS
jgi:hypothetical protein